MQPAIVIHGGAGDFVKGERLLLVRKSLHTILESVYPRLARGMPALDAAVLACTALEDDPLYNAGYGSKIQSDGKIRMSAALMDGSRRRFSGCVNVEGVRNPIHLAKALLKKRDRVLSGAGAKKFARELGLEFSSPYTAEQKAKYLAQKRGKSGTVGAVVVDKRGRLAAATSTGGKGFEYPFRVSDSPTVAGNFASSLCAVSATGIGEEIVEQSAAATICAFMEAGLSLDKAVSKLISRSRRYRADFGVIAIDRQGHIRVQTTKGGIVWGAADHSALRTL